MINNKIYKEMTTKLHAWIIRSCADKNGETPFGYIIDYIKDEYNLSKIEGWDTAKAVCEYFGFK